MRFLSMAIVGLIAVGCGPKDKTAVNQALNAARNAPLKDWIDSAPEGCAVGSAPYQQGMRSLASTASASAARAALARSMKTKVQGMLKTYQSMQTSEGKISSEQDITNVTRDIVDQDMYGSRIIKTEQRKDEFFALVCIDPGALEEALGKMNQLSEAMRAAIKTRAKNEFQDLDSQLEKLNVLEAAPAPAPVQQPAPAQQNTQQQNP